MDYVGIVQELKDEVAKIDRALAALAPFQQAKERRQARAQLTPFFAGVADKPRRQKRRPKFTQEGRHALSLAMKRRWKAAKAAGRASL